MAAPSKLTAKARRAVIGASALRRNAGAGFIHHLNFGEIEHEKY